MKLAGTVCILAACALTGFELERRLKQRWLFLREMQELLVFLEKETTYHRAALGEALCNAAEKCTTELSAVLLRVSAQVDERDGKAFHDIWQEAVDRCVPGGLLSWEELLTVREAADALCNTDIVTQRMLLEKYADRFRALSDREEKDCREKGRLYRRLSAAAGVFFVILLL